MARWALGAGVPALVVALVALGLLLALRPELRIGNFLPVFKLSHGNRIDEVVFLGFTGLATGIGLTTLTALVATVFVHARRPWAASLVVAAVVIGRVVASVAKDTFLVPRPVSPTLDTIQAPHITLPVAAALALVLVLVAVFTRLRRDALVALGLLAVLLVVDRIASALIQVDPGFDSFPSGHAAGSASLALAAVAVAWRTPRWRFPALVAGFVFVIGVGLSRIYLQEHYLADVLAGWCVAVIAVALAAGIIFVVRGLIDRRHERVRA